jgi:hypothetical protein
MSDCTHALTGYDAVRMAFRCQCGAHVVTLAELWSRGGRTDDRA